MNNQRADYFLKSASRYFSDAACPYCKSTSVSVIDRKYIFTRLFECNNCHLYFRHPKDEPGFNADFYQDDYTEYGITTNIPPSDVLEEYKKTNFKDSGQDSSDKVDTIIALVGKETFPEKPLKVIDYGASWGYISYQFLNAGFDVQSFDISKSMAEKGNDVLGLNIKNEVSELKPGNDIFFTSHVIEHLSDIGFLFKTAKQLLSEKGLFVCSCPNGSKAFRDEYPRNFSSSWGMVHPNLLSADFYSTVFKDNPYIITSTPYLNPDLFSKWDHCSQIVDCTSGDELLFVCAINITKAD